jgi:hypothetical protein
MSVAASASSSSVAAVLATDTPLRLHPGLSLSTDFVQPFPDLDTAFDPCDEDPHALVLIACAIFESTGCVALCRVSPNKYEWWLLDTPLCVSAPVYEHCLGSTVVFLPS